MKAITDNNNNDNNNNNNNKKENFSLRKRSRQESLYLTLFGPTNSEPLRKIRLLVNYSLRPIVSLDYESPLTQILRRK